MTEQKITVPVSLQMLVVTGLDASPADELLFQITTERGCGGRIQHTEARLTQIIASSARLMKVIPLWGYYRCYPPLPRYANLFAPDSPAEYHHTRPANTTDRLGFCGIQTTYLVVNGLHSGVGEKGERHEDEAACISPAGGRFAVRGDPLFHRDWHRYSWLLRCAFRRCRSSAMPRP